MTKKHDLEGFLRENPKAARHADSIRDTLEALRKLRESGVSGGGAVALTPPYVGGASIKGAPKPGNRHGIRSYSKVTFGA